MKVWILTALLAFASGLGLSAATITTNCTAQIQSTGACGAGDAGESGALIAYWASLVDDAPADPDIQSNALDLRDALCAHFGVDSCTTTAADGALRRFLENIVKQHRKAKKEAAIVQPATPVLDAQSNP